MTTPAATAPGLDELIDRLDAATAAGSTEAITAGVRRVLEETLSERRIELPEGFRRPVAEGYARRLLHLSEEHGYSVLAMVWGPGQATPIHDHDEMWCVEGVLDGEIEVEHYDLVERDGDSYRFASQGIIRAGVGDAGSLIPPFDHHTIRNPSDGRLAITVHVYEGEMTRCQVFEARGDGWYDRRSRTLGYS